MKGLILPTEIEELHAYGITRLYIPDDGRKLGLQGMINDVLRKSDYATGTNLNEEVIKIIDKDQKSIGRLISAAENFSEHNLEVWLSARCNLIGGFSRFS